MNEPMQPSKPKYITNKDLLREIHKSKASYCFYQQPEYANFDVIVTSLDDITEELIERIVLKKNTPKGKVIPEREFFPEDLVIRVMTHDHIPLDPDRKRKARNTDKSYARTNFPPFKHYVLRENAPVEVGRSHWKGDLETGAFCLDGGTMSNTLASMFMLLVERYSRRSNWRGYSYVDEMRSHALLQLSQIGLQFDESKSENPFAFFTTAIRNCFVRTQNLERRNQNIRDELLIHSGAAPSYTRQVESELEYRFPELAKKRGTPGRKPAGPPKPPNTNHTL